MKWKIIFNVNVSLPKLNKAKTETKKETTKENT